MTISKSSTYTQSELKEKIRELYFDCDIRFVAKKRNGEIIAYGESSNVMEVPLKQTYLEKLFSNFDDFAVEEAISLKELFNSL